MVPRSGQLRELLRLLDEAALVQPLADEIVAACGEPAEVATEVVRAGTRLQVVFHRLRERLDELEVGPDLDELREQASRLLLYHQWMLREALTAACSARAARSGRSGYRINGLGAPANRLRELRDGLATLVDTRA